MSETMPYKTRKFSELVTAYEADDKCELLIHDGRGLKKISKAKFDTKLTERIDDNDKFINLFRKPGALAHNNIYRGDNLGDMVTEAQYKEIKTGNFDNMYIGDYWKISKCRYRIASFDYYYNTGDDKCRSHHITIVPDYGIYKKQMNEELTTVGGYVSSKMYTDNIKHAEQDIENAFNGHVMSHSRLLSDSKGWDWYVSKVTLLNEVQVYGTRVRGVGKFDVSNNDRQLQLFALNNSAIHNGQTYWLLDIYEFGIFCCVNKAGHADALKATEKCIIRPVFSIC